MLTVTFHVVDDSAESLQDVVVRVYSEDGASFVTQGTTDVLGELTLDLEDDTTYWVRFFKIGYEFNNRLAIETDSEEDNNTFTITGTNLNAHPPATDSNYCRASGMFVDTTGAETAGVQLRFALQSPPKVVGGMALARSVKVVHTDEDGKVSIDLIRNAIYNVMVEGREDDPFQVRVPNASATDIVDLLWPVPEEVTFAEEEVEVAEEASEVISVALTMSNGVGLPYEIEGLEAATTLRLTKFVRFVVGDLGVCTVSINGLTNELTITGVSAGTTTVTAELLDSAPYIERFPAIEVEFGVLTVTVV